MSTAEKPPISWLDLAPAPDSPEITAALDRTRARLGYVRNGQTALLHRPGLVLAIDQLSVAATQNPDSGLSRKERELIALVVSIENKCQPCIFSHAAALRGITADPLWVAKVEANFRHAGLSERERALVDYALLITLDPASIEASDLDLLRDAGIPDADILDAAAVAAYFNFSNRINSSLGVAPNSEAFLAHR
jgi:uncharacterized peroxidase-related enzyme